MFRKYFAEYIIKAVEQQGNRYAPHLMSLIEVGSRHDGACLRRLFPVRGKSCNFGGLGSKD